MATEILISDLISISKKNIKYLLIKKSWILFFSILIGLTSAGIFSLISIKFKASFTLINENDNQNRLGSYASLAELVGIDLGTSSSNSYKGENLIELFSSKKVVKEVLSSSYNLNETFLTIYAKNHSITIDPIFYQDKFSSNKIRYNDSLVDNICIKIIDKQLIAKKLDKKNDIIEVHFEDTNEDFAFSFLNKLVEVTISFFIEYKTKKTNENIDIFTSQLDSVKNILFNNINSLSAQADDNLNGIKSKIKLKQQQQQLNQQANSSLYVELIRNLELSKISSLKEKPFLQIIDQPIKPLETNKVGFLKSLILGIFIGFLGTCIFLLYKKNYFN